jgi:HSP20 family protein
MHHALAYLGLPAAAHGAWTPNTDVYETADRLVVRMEVAGVERNDIEITLNERLLVVHGYRHDPCRSSRCQFRQMEIDYGFFERRIVIPNSVDGNRAHAVFDNGFLQIDLPKAARTTNATVTVVIERAN